MTISLILSNKPSPINRKIIKFFQINLIELNKASIIFEFDVVSSGDDSYKKKGITEFPVLLDNETKVTGVDKIISYLHIKIEGFNKGAQKKSVSISDNQCVDDFWKETIGDVNIDSSGKLKADEENNTESDDLQRKVQEAFKQRNNKPEVGRSSRTVKSDTPTKNTAKEPDIMDTFKNIKASGKSAGNMDDDLMEKFFENMQETDI